MKKYTWQEYKVLKESDGDDPMARFLAMRQGVFDTHDSVEKEREGASPYKPDTTNKGGPPSSNKIPGPMLDLIQSGFSGGGAVPDRLARFLRLSPTSSWVADSQLRATPRGPYPFYVQKRAGVPTGKYMFVQGYPIDRFIRDFEDMF